MKLFYFVIVSVEMIRITSILYFIVAKVSFYYMRENMMRSDSTQKKKKLWQYCIETDDCIIRWVTVGGAKVTFAMC